MGSELELGVGVGANMNGGIHVTDGVVGFEEWVRDWGWMVSISRRSVYEGSVY